MTDATIAAIVSHRDRCSRETLDSLQEIDVLCGDLAYTDERGDGSWRCTANLWAADPMSRAPFVTRSRILPG